MKAFDTYSRMLLGDSTPLSHLICKYSQPISVTTSDTPPLLSTTQIELALQSPLRTFFHQSFHAYACIYRAILEVRFLNEDALKKDSSVLNIDPIENSEIKHLKETSAQAILNKFNDAVSTHETQCRELLEYYTDQLFTLLADEGIIATELETKEFKDIENEEDLNKRFIDLKIERPKHKRKDLPFTCYLRDKTAIYLHSNLNRNHTANTDNSTTKQLKALNHRFDALNKAETELMTQQSQALKQILAPISFVAEAYE